MVSEQPQTGTAAQEGSGALLVRPGRAKGANSTSGARPQRPREPHSAALVAHSILTRCWRLALGTARWSRAFVCPRQGSAAGAHVAWKGSPASPLGAIGRGQCCRCHPPSIPQAPVFPFLVEQAAWQLLKKNVSLYFPTLQTM